MKDLYIVNCCRTAIGTFGGSLKNTPAVDLGAIVVKEALNRAGVKPEQVDEVMFGCILTAGLGQNPARQAAIKAGVPIAAPSANLSGRPSPTTLRDCADLGDPTVRAFYMTDRWDTANHPLHDLITGEVLGCAGLDHLAVTKHGGGIAHGEDFVHLVGDVNDGNALGAQRVDNLKQHLGFALGQSGGGLVHDEDLGIHHQGLADLHHLLLAELGLRSDRRRSAGQGDR